MRSDIAPATSANGAPGTRRWIGAHRSLIAAGAISGELSRPARPISAARIATTPGERVTGREIWAEVAHPARRGTGEFVRVLCGELAESFGDRVDGRLAGGDVDHEVVDVAVAGA